MKNSELKKLAAQFSEFLGTDFENIEGKIREFWFTTFSCNNAEREAELLLFWSKPYQSLINIKKITKWQQLAELQ